MHGHTYIGHPVSCAAALAVQQMIRRDNLLDNVRAMGDRLSRRLNERFGNHHHVGDVRGRGLFQAIELVADAARRNRSIRSGSCTHASRPESMQRGLMVYPMGGTIDGKRGDHVLLAPPFIVDDVAIDTIVERLGDAVDAAIGSA